MQYGIISGYTEQVVHVEQCTQEMAMQCNPEMAMSGAVGETMTLHVKSAKQQITTRLGARAQRGPEEYLMLF